MPNLQAAAKFVLRLADGMLAIVIYACVAAIAAHLAYAGYKILTW